MSQRRCVRDPSPDTFLDSLDALASNDVVAPMDHRISEALALLGEGPNITIPELAASIGLSVTHFRRLFHHEVGVSPREYVTRLRLARAATLLKTTHLRVKQIALELGVDRTHLVRQFTARYGCSPRRYRMGGSATK